MSAGYYLHTIASGEGGMAGRLVNWLWLTYNPFMPEGNAGRAADIIILADRKTTRSVKGVMC